MKNLKEYVYEGLADWGDDDKLDKKISKQTTKAAIKEEIIVWVAKNTTSRMYKNHFIFNFNTTPVTVDYIGGSMMILSPQATSMTNDMFQWGEIWGLSVSNNNNIVDFEGGPKKVYYLHIKNCPNLESLENGPEIYGRELICEKCPKLKTLPSIKEAKNIWVVDCPNIKYLNDCPEDVNHFRVMRCGLVSLEGGPKTAYEYLACDNKITSLKGAPDKVDGDFVIDNNPITSLKGGPKTAHRYLCNNTDIKNLEGGPEKAKAFSCWSCPNLTSLKGIEDSDIEFFYCYNTNITSLEYCPNAKVIDCGGTKLTNLKFLPKTTTNLTIDGIKTLKSLDGLHSGVVELSMINVPFMKNIRDYNIHKVHFK